MSFGIILNQQYFKAFLSLNGLICVLQYFPPNVKFCICISGDSIVFTMSCILLISTTLGLHCVHFIRLFERKLLQHFVKPYCLQFENILSPALLNLISSCYNHQNLTCIFLDMMAVFRPSVLKYFQSSRAVYF